MAHFLQSSCSPLHHTLRLLQIPRMVHPPRAGMISALQPQQGQLPPVQLDPFLSLSTLNMIVLCGGAIL